MNVCAFKKISKHSDVIMGSPKKTPKQFLVQLRSNFSVTQEYCTDSEEDAYMVYEAWEKRFAR